MSWSDPLALRCKVCCLHWSPAVAEHMLEDNGPASKKGQGRSGHTPDARFGSTPRSPAVQIRPRQILQKCPCCASRDRSAKQHAAREQQCTGMAAPAGAGSAVHGWKIRVFLVPSGRQHGRIHQAALCCVLCKL